MTASVVFVLGGLVAWGLNFVGLPGNWILVALAVGHSFVVPDQVAPFTLILIASFAGAGELIELGASAFGLTKGGSRQGVLGAVIGSMLGSLVGFGIGFPIPLIGPLIGIVLFSALGAMIGATYMEFREGKSIDRSLALGKIAFAGRLVGSFAKLILGFGAWLGFTIAVFR